MIDKKLIVIKFNNGTYWCGLNKIDVQLRKALIYTAVKRAREVADSCMKNSDPFRHHSITSYKLVEIKIYEVGEIE